MAIAIVLSPLAPHPRPNPNPKSLPLTSHIGALDAQRKWRIEAASAAPGVDLKALEAAIEKNDSDAVKETLNQLSELGWAKKWSSQPYVSRRMVDTIVSTNALLEMNTDIFARVDYPWNKKCREPCNSKC